MLRAKFETIEAGEHASFACRLFSGRGWGFSWHFHPEIELTAILRGSGQRFVGDHIGEFSQGDLVLLGANLPHTWYSRRPVRGLPHQSICIQFLPTCFGPGFMDRPEMGGVGKMIHRAAQGLHFSGSGATKMIGRMQRMCEMPPTERFIELISLLEALSHEHGTPLSSRGFVPSLHVEQQRRIDRVLRYITDHFDRDIDVAAVAEIAHLSASAFSRFFHRSTRKTFTRYVNELRVGKACEMLSETDKNIAVVAMDCGFGNLSNFNRRFLEMRGVRPREYRRRFIPSPGTPGEG